MGRPLCGVLSAEGKMYVAFVKDEGQAGEFMKLLSAPEALIIAYCKDHNIECEERRLS